MTTIVIGTDPSQFVAQRVLEYSIRKHTDADIKIVSGRQTQQRLGGTRFGFVRFLVPSLCDYQGTGIYMDADQLVLGDVAELAALLQPPHAIGIGVLLTVEHLADHDEVAAPPDFVHRQVA